MSLVGQRFGRLTVLNDTDRRMKRSVVWECRCDCGNVTLVPTHRLRSKHTQSCGCKGNDLTGQQFGKLTVVKRSDQQSVGIRVIWECRCDCGNMTLVATDSLRSKHTQSCGCFKFEARVTHGKSNTPEYHTWEAMLQRCFNPNSTHYEYYGAIGITVEDKRWMTFENFYADMGLKPAPEYTLDRIDNNKGYYKDNCHWATRLDQTHNRRSSAKYLILDEDPILLED